jgi:hypothetical protein
MEAFVNMLLTAVGALGAAFLGAWYAFRLNNNASAHQTVRERVAAINKALFVLVRQFNSLRAIQNQIINPARADLTRFINLRSVLPISAISPRIDVDSLSFLLETEYRGLLMELIIEQERFETAVQAINERSRLHLEVLQPRMASGGIMESVDYPAEKVIEVLSEPLVLHMQRATDDAIQHVDDTVNSNLAFAERFHREMKMLFPKYSIIHFQPMEPSHPTVNTDATR